MNFRSRLSPFLFIPIVLILLGYFISRTHVKGETKHNGSLIPTVITAPITRSDIETSLNSLGTVTARNTLSLHTRVAGELTKILFTEGQNVAKGQLLAVIDPRPYEVALKQTEGQLLKDEALLSTAQTDLERYRILLKQDSIARQQYDTQESLVKQFQGTVMTDKAAVENAQINLGFTQIKAPYTGRIGLRQVDLGNLVQPSDQNSIAVITEIDPITVVFSVPQNTVTEIYKQLQTNKKIKVDAWDQENKRLLASSDALTLDNLVDTTTGTVKIKTLFNNKDHKLFPNQFVNIRLHLNTLKDALIVPSAAILRGTPGTYIYVVRPDKTAAIQPVQVLATEDDHSAIIAAACPASNNATTLKSCTENDAKTLLVPGQQVIVDGSDRVREGSKIQTSQRTRSKN